MLTHHGLRPSTEQNILNGMGMSAMSYSIDSRFVLTPLKLIIRYLHSGASSRPGFTTAHHLMHVFNLLARITTMGRGMMDLITSLE